MNREEFLRKLKKRAKSEGVDCSWDPKRGKGSHGTVYYNGKGIPVPCGELKKGLVNGVLAYLEVKKPL